MARQGARCVRILRDDEQTPKDDEGARETVEAQEVIAVEQRGDTRQAPEPAANPLRRGELVTCPVCGASGERWQWELKRSPRYREWTTVVFRCRGQRCGHTFALREDG